MFDLPTVTQIVHFQNEGISFLISENALYLFLFRSFKQYTDCKIIAIPAKYNFKPYAFGFQKDSPFLPMFNFYLKEMREKGSLKKILDKYESPPQVCPDYNGKPLGFGAVFTAFGVLGLGVVAGILLFLLEGFSALTSKKLIN